MTVSSMGQIPLMSQCVNFQLRNDVMGQKQTNHRKPKSIFVRCYTNNGHSPVRMDCPHSANNRHHLLNPGANRPGFFVIGFMTNDVDQRFIQKTIRRAKYAYCPNIRLKLSSASINSHQPQRMQCTLSTRSKIN